MSKFIKVTNYIPNPKLETLINTECISKMNAVLGKDERYYVDVGSSLVMVDAQDAQRIFDIIGISL